jgi:aspartyl-tRNA(Asn)/glutamyl-tRNA(Gln) amidotransferase subunit C
MAHITRGEVEHVVALARLSLTSREIDRMAREIDAILGYVEALQAVDTTDVLPTSHVIPLATPLREDRADAPIDPELAVANAPEHEGSAFVVPAVIDGEGEG